MAQANIDLIGSTRKCRYCDKTFKSEAGENNQMKRIHPLDMDSDARCWTCNKPFTKRQMLYQHFSTVQHQINCKKFHQGEMPHQYPYLDLHLLSSHSKPQCLKQIQGQILK